jgi:hypothetical protein
MDAWYAILQMQEYIKYADDMLLPGNLRNRFANMADVNDKELRKNWGRIQQLICRQSCTMSTIGLARSSTATVYHLRTR